MSAPITRTLAREDRNGNRVTIDQGEIATLSAPVIILGNPGLGKSILTATLGDLPTMRYITAGTFVRTADPASLIEKGQRIVIDGLDEIASSTPGGGMGRRALDRLDALQSRMHASNTDVWEAYWANSKPRSENFCRNRLIDHISGCLPDSIRFEPEMHMPGQKRADIAAIRESIGLPVEIKCQWHKEVWDARHRSA